MKYEESEKSGYKEREDEDFVEGVHIRQDPSAGVVTYAVFDGNEQVSSEGGPLNEDYILNFTRGYSEAKKRYNE